MKKSFTVALSVVLVFVLVFVLAFAGCTDTPKSGFTTDKIVMTYVASPLNVPSVIEKQRGDFSTAFQKLGLDFAYADLDSGADQTTALASGDIQILNAVGGSSVILAAANGADIVILSMYSVAPQAFAMFSAEAQLNSPESLRGKTIAGPKGTNLHELLAAYLATADMTEKDVNFVSMDIPSAAAALENGSIDVALLGGPAAYTCEKNGRHKITDGEGLISATIVTASTRKFAQENPEVIETFLKTQNEIVSYMQSDTDAALSLTAEALDLDPQAVKAMYAMYDFNTALTDEAISGMQSTETFLFNSGLIENHVDVSSIVLK